MLRQIVKANSDNCIKMTNVIDVDSCQTILFLDYYNVATLIVRNHIIFNISLYQSSKASSETI